MFAHFVFIDKSWFFFQLRDLVHMLIGVCKFPSITLSSAHIQHKNTHKEYLNIIVDTIFISPSTNRLSCFPKYQGKQFSG